ncbi:ryanodine receptor-like [Rhipicephalus microplus]|uniref:ryanodine receptor-like n=1 Tax=Rhipicephalus microplus TaxID=6941 RepID=UPI003F6D3BA2
MLSCVLVLEQALSVRALQEMVTAANSDTGKGTQSGHRTLLYGHAVLLRHQNSNMYLACLSSSSYNDKLAFDVGLQDHCQGEACWWTIHPGLQAEVRRREGPRRGRPHPRQRRHRTILAHGQRRRGHDRERQLSSHSLVSGAIWNGHQ